jgi:ABC-type thiamin/hydroxymethylpyrimidine transport system permease subunit
MVSQSNRFTTLDIVFMVLVGVVFGTLFAFTAPITHFITAALGPWADGLLGIYMIPPVLASFVVRKPGAYWITMAINLITQGVAGNPAGLLVTTAWGVAGGLGGELVHFVSRYQWQRTSFRYWFALQFIAVAMTLVFNIPISTYFYGWGTAGVFAIIWGTLVQFVFFGLESGLIGLGLGKVLLNAGMLSGFRIAVAERGVAKQVGAPRAATS